MSGRVYLSPPDVGDLERRYLLAALDSGWIAPLGPQVDAFEEELAAYCGRRHCVALSSGTAALHLGLLILGVGPGDVVVTSSMTFAATANAVVYTGAEPVFVDADASGNMNPDLLENALDELEREGRRAKVVLPVDLLGKVVEHSRIDPLAAKFGAEVLSDSAESLGATFSGRPAPAYGRVSAVSFNGNRNLNKVKTAAAFVEIHRALQSSVYRRLGIEGREPDYFLRQYLAVQVEMTSKSSSEELLFSWLQEAEKATALSEKLREAALRANAARSAGLPSPAEMEAAEPAAHDPAAPDVSVIIPVYNTDEYLTSCIGSVLAQTGVDLEVICVDDGSTDLSGAVLDQLAAGDTRITVIHQANLGQSVARNRGIDAAKGRYLCFVDSDDWWQEDSLAELVEWADNERLDLVLFDASTVREPGVTDETWESFRTYYERSAYVGVRSGPELLGAMRARSEYVVSPCLYLIRADRLHRSGLRFYPGIVHEDNLFTFELMLGAGRAGHSQNRLYSRRLRPGSTMTAGSQLASAQGYLISYLEMVRLAGRTMYPQATTSAVAKIMFSTLKGVYSSYAALDTEGVRRLEEVDPSPEAQALLLLLKHWRSLARSKGRSGRPSKPPADAPPSATAAVADGTPAKRTSAPVRPRSILERGTARVRRIARQIVRGWQRS